MKAHNAIDLNGKRFGRLLVLNSAPTQKQRAMWRCLCDCGNQKVVSGKQLRKGMTKSCGCLMREWQNGIENASRLKTWQSTHSHPCITHGEGSVKSPTRRFTMFHAAKQRARIGNLAFDLIFSDMPVMPDTCPVLGLRLEKGLKTMQPNSPTLDRISDNFGYTKGNVRIISHRANLLKNNANSDELSQVLRDSIEIACSEVDAFALS